MPALPLSLSAEDRVASGGEATETQPRTSKTEMGDSPKSATLTDAGGHTNAGEPLLGCAPELQQKSAGDGAANLKGEEAVVNDSCVSVEVKVKSPRGSAKEPPIPKATQRSLQQRPLNRFFPHLPSPPICKEKARKKQHPTQRLEKSAASTRRLAREGTAESPETLPRRAASEKLVKNQTPLADCLSESALSAGVARAASAETPASEAALKAPSPQVSAERSPAKNSQSPVELFSESEEVSDASGKHNPASAGGCDEDKRELIEIDCTTSSSEEQSDAAPSEDCVKQQSRASPPEKPQEGQREASSAAPVKGLSAPWRAIFKSQLSSPPSNTQPHRSRPPRPKSALDPAGPRRRPSATKTSAGGFSDGRSQQVPSSRAERARQQARGEGRRRNSVDEEGAGERRRCEGKDSAAGASADVEEQRVRLLTERRRVLLARCSWEWLESLQRRAQRQRREGGSATEEQRRSSVLKFFRERLAARSGHAGGPLTVFVQGPFLFFPDDEVRAILEAAGRRQQTASGLRGLVSGLALLSRGPPKEVSPSLLLLLRRRRRHHSLQTPRDVSCAKRRGLLGGRRRTGKRRRVCLAPLSARGGERLLRGPARGGARDRG